MKRLLVSLVSTLVVVGHAAPIASAATVNIDHTGPDSNTQVSVGDWGSGFVNHVVNNNNTDIDVSNWQYAQSGDATVSDNTNGGDATTGDATNENNVMIDVAVDNGG